MRNLVVIAFLVSGFLIACGGGSAEQQNGQESTTPEEPIAKAEPVIKDEPGKQVYDQYCIVCHQADGQGVPNAFPPLIKTDWVLGDKERLIGLVLNGLNGEIEVNGETYNGAMVAHDFLSDEDIANVLTYVRGSFSNEAGPVTVEEVATVRAAQ